MTLSTMPVIIAGGWDGGGDTSGLIWVILLLGLPYLALVPLTLIEGTFTYGAFAWVQTPLLILVVCAAFRHVRDGPLLRRVLRIGLVYCMVTMITNIWAISNRVDHSSDFPLTDMLFRTPRDVGVTVESILTAHGTPSSQLEISVDDEQAPNYLRSALRLYGLSQARVLVYRETSSWKRTQTCYLLFDVLTGRFAGATLAMLTSHPDNEQIAEPNRMG